MNALPFPAPAPRVHPVTVKHGLSVLQRLGLDLSRLGTPLLSGGWVDWSALSRILNAVEGQLTEARVLQFGDLFASGHPLLRLVGPLRLSPRGVAELVSRANAPLGVRWHEHHTSFSESRVNVRIRQATDLAGCRLWWRLWCSAFSAAPRAVSQPALTLRSATITPHSLEATWELPSPRPLPGPGLSLDARDALSALFPLMSGLESVDETTAGLDDQAALTRSLGLTKAEARVALHIADGLTPRETASELGVAYETVRTHLRNIYQALEVSSQRELATFIDHWRRPQ